jgi:hypothetical protein
MEINYFFGLTLEKSEKVPRQLLSRSQSNDRELQRQRVKIHNVMRTKPTAF